MVGLGETDQEVVDAMMLLRDAGVHMITIGQYLRPTDRHLPVDRVPRAFIIHDVGRGGEEDGF